jgi:hypothetical protein
LARSGDAKDAVTRTIREGVPEGKEVIVLRLKFRAQNAFGGTRLNDICFAIDPRSHNVISTTIDNEGLEYTWPFNKYLEDR